MSQLSDQVREARGLPPRALRRAIREAAGVSQVRLAEALGVHRMTVLRWENGSREPRGDQRIAYARILRELEEASR